MKHYAITRLEDSEFYPDPTYTDEIKLKNKLEYLNREGLKYIGELLTKKRAKQHEEEWQKWYSIAIELINEYKIHDPQTGLLIWKPDTPEYIVKLEEKLHEANLDGLMWKME